MIRFASLGSGSAGNALVVQAGKTSILVDCGFSMQETCRRLGRLGLEPANLAGIVVTHEHADHIGASAPLARRFQLPAYMTRGTYLAARDRAYPQWQAIHDGATVAIGDLVLHPFTVPHDAREPAQFIFSDGAFRLALLTDAGHVSPHMIACVDGSDALLLECNHDPAMLAAGRYPPALKRRVAGPYGHLANYAAQDLLTRIDHGRLQHVIGMHLSERNNRPELARAALANGLGCSVADTQLATQAEGFGWRQVG